MKRIFFLAWVTMLSFKVFANDTLVFRIINPSWPEKDPNGKYVRKVISTRDSGFLVLDYDETNLLSRGYYSDSDFTTRIYGHYFYNLSKAFVQEIKYYDGVGNLKIHAELSRKGDTIWRQTFKEGIVVSSWVFHEHESERTIFFSMQKPAVYPGGAPGWKRFVASNLRYPKDASNKKIDGIVMVEFTVSTEGKVGKAKVIQSAGPLLDQEAVRLVSASNWIPAEENGNKVSSRQRQSVIFKL